MCVRARMRLGSKTGNEGRKKNDDEEEAYKFQTGIEKKHEQTCEEEEDTRGRGQPGQS